MSSVLLLKIVKMYRLFAANPQNICIQVACYADRSCKKIFVKRLPVVLLAVMVNLVYWRVNK